MEARSKVNAFIVHGNRLHVYRNVYNSAGAIQSAALEQVKLLHVISLVIYGVPLRSSSRHIHVGCTSVPLVIVFISCFHFFYMSNSSLIGYMTWVWGIDFKNIL